MQTEDENGDGKVDRNTKMECVKEESKDGEGQKIKILRELERKIIVRMKTETMERQTEKEDD